MYEYKAKLVRVVDGDTVDAMIDCGFSVFRKERIRLKGINAPESRTRDKEEKKRGLAAKARLKELIKEGKNEFMVKTSIDKKGKYGRLLGELFLILKSNNTIKKANIKSYNQTLVDEGHATYYDGGKR
jgi:micrococcal nuclease|tara:strand:- start:11 stop:394 length:384 start_codon:yes stop_codon:yes gene_type:complete